MATNPGATAPERPAQGVEVRGAEVGKFRPLDVAPDRLHRIQLWSITGQALDGQPPALIRHIVAHQVTLMSRQPIPDQNHRLSTEVTAKIPQERNQPAVGVAARVGLKEEAGVASIPPERQRASDGQPFPRTADMRQDGRFAPWRPRPADDRLLRETALVLEDEPRPPAPGVFFSCGQRWVFHRSIARSSRSRARRAGRCSDQPRPTSTRHTWPGWCRTSVRRSMSSATRGRVHKSVANPCARGPARSARSIVASWAASNRGFRPARPAPLSPARPWAFQVWNQWWALTRVTPKAFATATCDAPRANSRAAVSRRAFIAAKSRAVVDMLQHAIVPGKSVSLFCEPH